ncbi:MAG TPA: YbaB/EbfC family nucleoid-associated protein [Pseudonocardiaceae bacterium]|nr:YbaB/EbfC family nucleoid-associated protein [Pseudonocardiaceae bacterium]
MTHSDAADPPGGLDAQIARLREQAEKVQEHIRTATATVSSSDESVTVTVGAGGAVTDVRFGDRAYQRPPQQLAGLLMQVIGKAQQKVSTDVSTAFAGLVGKDSTAMSLLDQFRPPEPPPEPTGPPMPPSPIPPPPPMPTRRSVQEMADDEPESWLEDGRIQ